MKSEPTTIDLPETWKLLRSYVRSSPSVGDRTFLVGGAVRDLWIRKFHPSLKISESFDLDLVVEREGGAKNLAQFLHSQTPQLFSQPHELGRGYPIWQLAWKQEPWGTIEVQIADTQSEMFPDPLTRQRVTRFGSLIEDCARRDFTVNMLYWDLRTQELLDPSGSGLEDLKQGLIRGHPRVDTAKIFRDDPLRMLRALRFHARFLWPIADETWKSIREEFARVKILSPERVRDEFLKIIESGHFADVLSLLQKEQLLETLIPEALPLLGCGQDKTYHSEGDVWVHTLLVMKAAPVTPLLQLAAFLHDWGKPDTRMERHDGRITFLNHEKYSVDRAREWLKKWRFPKKLSEDILTLVALHLRGGDVVAWKSLKPARKLLREAGDLMGPLLQLIEADSSSSLGPDGSPRLDHIPLLRDALAQASALQTMPKTVLSGHKIIELFGVEPGPKVKALKQEAEAIYEEALLKGEILNEKELIHRLKKSQKVADRNMN